MNQDGRDDSVIGLLVDHQKNLVNLKNHDDYKKKKHDCINVIVIFMCYCVKYINICLA